MKKRTRQELQKLREWAESLYLAGESSQKEIAHTVGVTEKTMKNWRDEGEWDTLKAATSISKAAELKRLYAQVNELNAAIQKKEAGERFADSKEADILSKLTAAIKALEGELNLSEIVNVSTDLLTYIKRLHFEDSQKFAEYINAYIKGKLSDAN